MGLDLGGNFVNGFHRGHTRYNNNKKKKKPSGTQKYIKKSKVYRIVRIRKVFFNLEKLVSSHISCIVLLRSILLGTIRAYYA